LSRQSNLASPATNHPSDPTIEEKFNTCRFTDYKGKVIDLLIRVCTVRVKTMEIVILMKKEEQINNSD